MREKILELRLQGFSYREISKRLNCSKGTVAYHLGEGQKEKTRARSISTRKKRNLEIAKLKDVPCADCGGKFGFWCMDFDHVSGEKVDTVSNILKFGTWQQVLDEVDKCEVVCSNCHRTRTRNRGYTISWI